MNYQAAAEVDVNAGGFEAWMLGIDAPRAGLAAGESGTIVECPTVGFEFSFSTWQLLGSSS